MTGFSYELKDLGEHGVELALIGYMDEKTELPSPEKLKNFSRLTINFARVNAILSMGVKAWIRFADDVERIPQTPIEFKNCSKAIIDQINLVVGFLPKNAHVTSLYVPVYCPDCQASVKSLQKVDDIKTLIHKVPAKLDTDRSLHGPGCQGSFELECNPEAYLKFLDRH